MSELGLSINHHKVAFCMQPERRTANCGDAGVGFDLVSRAETHICAVAKNGADLKVQIRFAVGGGSLELLDRDHCTLCQTYNSQLAAQVNVGSAAGCDPYDGPRAE